MNAAFHDIPPMVGGCERDGILPPASRSPRLTAKQSQQFLADALESLGKRDRVSAVFGILAGELTDEECTELGNRLGRVPHERMRK